MPMSLAPRPRPTTAADDRLIDQVVEELNQLHREATFDQALAIGRVIVERFYAGDLSVWRKHAGKDTSFRKLAARTGRDLHATATTLYRAVALYELSERLGVSTWQHLSVSHLRAVLGLPEDQQRELLVTADLARWTTKRLEAETRRLRSTHVVKRGRPPLPAFVKTINRMVTLLQDQAEVSVDPDEIRQMSDLDVRRLAKVLDSVQATLSGLQQQLEARIRCA